MEAVQQKEDDYWFMFPPQAGPGGDGQWWNYTPKRDQWVRKGTASRTPTTQDERNAFADEIVARWKSRVASSPDLSRSARAIDLAGELGITKGRIAFAVKKAGLRDGPRASKIRRQAQVVEREKMMLSLWDRQDVKRFKNNMQRCISISKRMHTAPQVAWDLMVKTGRIVRRTRKEIKATCVID